MHLFYTSLAFTIAITAAPSVLGAPQIPVPQVVLLALDPLPGVPGVTFTGVEWIGTNHTGGLIATISGSGAGFNRGLWGTLGGGSAGLVREPGVGPATGILNVSRGASGAGEKLAYLGDLAGAGQSLFAEDLLVATVGDTTAPMGGTWQRFDEPFIQMDGTPWFRGLYNAGNGGVWGLFRGTSLTQIFGPNTAVPGLPGMFASVSGGPDSGYDVSENGLHWMGVIRNDNGAREAVVRDGQVLSAGGVPLVSWNPLPPHMQASPGESWNHFDRVQITDGDRWACIAFTPFGILLRDGSVFVRNGDVVAGFTLGSDFRSLSMNRHGGLAWIGRIQLSVGGSSPAVFRERELLMQLGDEVDIDGDGVVDPGWTVAEIPGGPGGLAYAEDGTIWVHARLNRPGGGLRWAVIGFSDVFGVPFCSSQPNSSGRAARIQATGSPVLLNNDLRLRCVDMPMGSFGFFLCSRTQGFVAGPGGSQGDLCLGGNIGRFSLFAASSGGIFAIETPIDLSVMPQPLGLVQAVVGEAWNFQCWFRDANPTVTSNLSNGIEVTIQ